MTMITKTTMSEPVQLGLPKPDPVPVNECDECGALAEQRGVARRNGDLSKVSDLNVWMRAHQRSGCA